MKNNGKNNFYRTLELDKDSKDVLKWYKKIVVDLMNDKYKEEENERDSKI